MATAKKNKKTTKKPAPKNSQKKSKNNLLVKYYNKYPTRFVLDVVLFIFVGFYIVNQELPKVQEKRDLVEKHQKLEEIADKITATYPTNDRSSEKYCEYSSAKFEKGQLSCTVSVRLKYNEVEIDKANLIKNIVSKELNLNVNKSRAENLDPYSFGVDSNKLEINHFYADIFEENSKCRVGFTYDLGSGSDKILYISARCYVSPAKAEHFPVKK